MTLTLADRTLLEQTEANAAAVLAAVRGSKLAETEAAYQALLDGLAAAIDARMRTEYGIGVDGGIPAPGDDADLCVDPKFNFRFSTQGTNTPEANPFGASLQVFAGTLERLTQVYFSSNGQLWTRTSQDQGGNWAGWTEHVRWEEGSRLTSPAGPGQECLQPIIADGAVFVFEPRRLGGIVEVVVESRGNFPQIDFSGTVIFDCGPTPGTVLVGGGTKFEIATGPLTGATGNPDRWTVSAHSDGQLYVENGSDTPRSVSLIVRG